MFAAPHPLAEILLASAALDISRYDPAFLEKSLRKRMVATACRTVEHYSSLLERHQDEARQLAEALGNSYSLFFRNPLTFAVLERIVLPQLIGQRGSNRGKEIRIWSTACASGQEAYSLAILLEELHRNQQDAFDYRLFATDHCPQQIDQARRGQYSAAALDNVSRKRAAQWFNRQGEVYTIHPRLRDKIDFSVFDLCSDHLSCPPASIFGDFDLVVCANLLFYYNQPWQKILLEKTANSLVEGGLFVTGEAERDIVSHYQFHEIYPQSGIFRLHISARST